MKKLVLKTAIITFVSILIAVAITFGILCQVSPKTLASISNSLGNKGLAVNFYQQQYNKTKDIEDLYVLVNYVDEVSQSKIASTYSGYLISDDGFSSFATEKDEGKTGAYITTKEYVYAKNIVSLYLENDLSKGIDNGKAYVSVEGYTSYNPFTVLVMKYAEEFSLENKNVVKTVLEEIKLQLNTETEKIQIQSDIDLLN